MQRGALIQHHRHHLEIADRLQGIELEYIDPTSLDSPRCIDLMLAGNYDCVLPCLTIHDCLAFRLAEVAHVANLETRVIMFTASPDERMLRLFDWVLGKPLSDLDVRGFAQAMARPVRRLRTRVELDSALAAALPTAYLVHVGGHTEWQPAPSLSLYRQRHPALPVLALTELAREHHKPHRKWPVEARPYDGRSFGRAGG
jgi:hypothetical protein